MTPSCGNNNKVVFHLDWFPSLNHENIYTIDPNNINHATIIQKQVSDHMITCLSETEKPSSAAKKVTLASEQTSFLVTVAYS